MVVETMSLDEHVFFEVLHGTKIPQITISNPMSSAMTITSSYVYSYSGKQTIYSQHNYNEPIWTFTSGRTTVQYRDEKAPPLSSDPFYAHLVCEAILSQKGTDIRHITEPLKICQTALLIMRITNDNP